MTIKKIRGSVVEKNCDRVKELRCNYLSRVLKEDYRTRQCVYIDEIGFNMWLRRPNGRSIRGQPINRTIPNTKGRNISCVMAITTNGPIHYKIVDGSFKCDYYQAFILELSEKLTSSKHSSSHSALFLRYKTSSARLNSLNLC